MGYTLEQFAKKNGLLKQYMTHDQYYQTLVDMLGYDDILKYIPYSISEVSRAMACDKCLNNLPLKEWDEMTGVGRNKHNMQYINHKGLYHIYKKHNITVFSQAEGVCLLKACAIMAVIREGLTGSKE